MLRFCILFVYNLYQNPHKVKNKKLLLPFSKAKRNNYEEIKRYLHAVRDRHYFIKPINQHKMKKIIAICLSATLVFASCSSWTKTTNGTLLGSGAGAALGAGIGLLIGNDAESAAIGAAIGGAVGGGAGAVIGHKMDKKAEELAALEAAQIEKITDVNGLEGIKVTFDSGILFGFNSSKLNSESKKSLDKFAETMADMTETDITVYGHTDNVGTEEANVKVSTKRAEEVAGYLTKAGIAKERITSKGMSFTMPVADNDTEEGRAQNRRVEIYITANENMIKEAEAQN